MTALTDCLDRVQRFQLSSAAVEAIEDIIARGMEMSGSGSAAELIRIAERLSRKLPDSLADAIGDFRAREAAPAFLLQCFPVSDDLVGPTPLHWKDAAGSSSTLREELFCALIASCVGAIYSWSTLQDGRLIQDVVPIPNEQKAQSGHGTVNLAWHTEDGFHSYRCDYLCLMGIRNRDRIPTTFADVGQVALDEKCRNVLSEPRFLIRPDKEHLRGDASRSRLAMMELENYPEPCAVLFGDPRDPYLRIDPAFMAPVAGDWEAAAALEEIIRQLEQALQSVVLAPGDLFIIDNYKAVHGRAGFTARYDGTDRWLKKVLVTRDLRKSRVFRAAPDERVLG